MGGRNQGLGGTELVWLKSVVKQEVRSRDEEEEEEEDRGGVRERGVRGGERWTFKRNRHSVVQII